MNKVLLVKAKNDIVNTMPPLGLGYLAAALKKNGVEAGILDCNVSEIDIPGIVGRIKRENIQYVGVSLCSNEHNWLKRFCDACRDIPSLFIIAGGAHPTGLKERLLLLLPRLDFVIYSEGEASLPLLVNALEGNGSRDLSLIPNLIWRQGERLVTNPLELPRDLDELGFPDWPQISPVKYAEFAPHGGFSMAVPVAQIITTRGCPYACSYCAGYLVNGVKIRKRSTASIISEIKYLIDNFGVKEIHIEDDNFTFDKEHVLSLCKALKQNNIRLHFGLPNGIRLDRVDDEILSEMQSCGFYFFSVGVESGSERILKRMHKALSVDKIRAGLRLIRKYPFIVKGFFMMGYPTETLEDIRQTVGLSKELDLDQAFFSLFVPIPGTREFELLEKAGTVDITTCDWDNFYAVKNANPPYVPDTLTVSELKDSLASAFRSFYFRPGILLHTLSRINSLSGLKIVFKLGTSLFLKK